MRNQKGKASEALKVTRYRQRLSAWLKRMYGVELTETDLEEREVLQAFRDGVTSPRLARKYGEGLDLVRLN